ncbi:MAG: LarC family nickel insertion protein [bacterium]|nr:LarC family nickel insertion protein [bacterium]
MKLLIDPKGGMAGDMFSAALVSAGADFDRIREAMEAAGNVLGSARVAKSQTSDGATQLSIELESDRHHLGGNEARQILEDLFSRFDIREQYRDLGMRILQTLIKAEIRAHAEFNIVVEGDHTHNHDHSPGHSHKHSHDHSHDHSDGHSHSHSTGHSHGDSHHHPHSHTEEAFLHEAQDIVLDIMGAVTGLQELKIEPEAELLSPISVGGGHVVCSHGKLSIPAPATTVILEEYQLQWNKGPISKELLTPTGAAVLAALGSKIRETQDTDTLKIKSTGTARGSKILDIPPLKLLLHS